MGNKIEDIKKTLEEYKKAEKASVKATSIPDDISEKSLHSPVGYQSPIDYNTQITQETDPDLMIGYEVVPLPSQGKFYKNELASINALEIAYMTSEDEDFITTPSLIDSGEVLIKLVNKKLKNKIIKGENLLSGDFNALLLFLRKSSYGPEYKVEVTDPRTGESFPDVVDLNKLKYKEINKLPNEEGLFTMILPMRNKQIKFRLLFYGEDQKIFNQAEEIKKAYNLNYSPYKTLKLKAEIVEIQGKRDLGYIHKFIEKMPAGDAFAVRKEILDISPDIDMAYEFITKDGFKFKSQIVLGLDFFFPDI